MPRIALRNISSEGLLEMGASRTETRSQNSYITLEFRELVKSGHCLMISKFPSVWREWRTYCLGLNNGSRNTEDGYNKDASGIVIIVVQRPQDEARNLEDIKRVDSLARRQKVHYQNRYLN